MERSYEKITKKDLRRILDLARCDIEEFFNKYPKYGDIYRSKETLIVLGQGAALHYINGNNGVKDFDVWFFFPKKKRMLPYRRRGTVDYGASKFGKHPDDKGYEGRRIDILMRSASNFDGNDAKYCLHTYLEKGRTSTSKLLAKKAMVGLWPEQFFGKVLWPPNTSFNQDARQTACLPVKPSVRSKKGMPNSKEVILAISSKEDEMAETSEILTFVQIRKKCP